VAGRYRALHQIVADVPDPIGDAYLRISKSWRSLSRQDKQLALAKLEGLEAQSDELGGAGLSLVTVSGSGSLCVKPRRQRRGGATPAG